MLVFSYRCRVWPLSACCACLGSKTVLQDVLVARACRKRNNFVSYRMHGRCDLADDSSVYFPRQHVILTMPLPFRHKSRAQDKRALGARKEGTSHPLLNSTVINIVTKGPSAPRYLVSTGCPQRKPCRQTRRTDKAHAYQRKTCTCSHPPKRCHGKRLTIST